MDRDYKNIYNQDPIVVQGQVRITRSQPMTIFSFNNELSKKIKGKKEKYDDVDLIKAKTRTNQK